MHRPESLTAPPPWRAIGQVVASVTDNSGRAAIARLLQCASNGDGDAFEQADWIRRRLGLNWDELLARAA